MTVPGGNENESMPLSDPAAAWCARASLVRANSTTKARAVAAMHRDDIERTILTEQAQTDGTV
jgi:hypothetical protein